MTLPDEFILDSFLFDNQQTAFRRKKKPKHLANADLEPEVHYSSRLCQIKSLIPLQWHSAHSAPPPHPPTTLPQPPKTELRQRRNKRILSASSGAPEEIKRLHICRTVARDDVKGGGRKE